MQLILASGSPRRRELIQLLGIDVEILVSDVDESVVVVADPAQNAVETARLKAEAVSQLVSQKVIIGADTNVAIDGDILGKPRDERDAVAMLERLRGRVHFVHTGMVVIDQTSGLTKEAVSTSAVRMRPYSDAEIADYVASGDPMDKAGAYGIQNAEFGLVEGLEGCFAGVMGLSLCGLGELLGGFEKVVGHCRSHHEVDVSQYERLMRFG